MQVRLRVWRYAFPYARPMHLMHIRMRPRSVSIEAGLTWSVEYTFMLCIMDKTIVAEIDPQFGLCVRARAMRVCISRMGARDACMHFPVFASRRAKPFRSRVPIAVFDMAQHLTNYYRPSLQRYVIRIIAMVRECVGGGGMGAQHRLQVPLYAVESWMSLRYNHVRTAAMACACGWCSRPRTYVVLCVFSCTICLTEIALGS